MPFTSSMEERERCYSFILSRTPHKTLCMNAFECACRCFKFCYQLLWWLWDHKIFCLVKKAVKRLRKNCPPAVETYMLKDDDEIKITYDAWIFLTVSQSLSQYILKRSQPTKLYSWQAVSTSAPYCSFMKLKKAREFNFFSGSTYTRHKIKNKIA
jgi:hypothetical protein